MTHPTKPHGELHWLLDQLVVGVPEVHHAILLSQDGLVLAWSEGIERDEAEHLSAVASGLNSLSHGAAQRFNGGRVRQTVIEMENAFLFVTNAGRGARLAVLASAEVDAGIAAYEMAMTVNKVGGYLSAAPRAQAASSGAQ